MTTHPTSFVTSTSGRAPRKTLMDVLRRRAEREPSARAFTFLRDGEGDRIDVSYGQLDRDARAIAATLASVCTAGDRAVLLFSPGVEYVTAFFGCLYARVLAVPAYPPHPLRPRQALQRLRGIMSNAEASVVLTTDSIAAIARQAFTDLPELASARWLSVDASPLAAPEDWRAGEPADLAFLQYTSGSTGEPKGAMISHANLLANLDLISRTFGANEESVGVIWLPPYHDLGLIGGILFPIYEGFPTVLSSPFSFLQRPERWLRAIERYRGTISGGPTFAFDFATDKIPEGERFDLSSWETAFVGAEPVSAESLARFARRFEADGFRRTSFYPCYGLAEATLMVSGAGRGNGACTVTVDATALEGGKVVLTRDEAKKSRTLVSAGRVEPDQEVLIVDRESMMPCAEGRTGEIFVAQPSVARGYWKRNEETAAAFDARLADGRGPFLRTGDVGFFHGDDLYVAGRVKDLVILYGRKFYPQDLETTAAQSHPALQRGGVVAFTVENQEHEELVIVAEYRPVAGADPRATASAIRKSISEEHEVAARHVVLVQPGAIPKTSSGKLQRHACRADYLAARLDRISEDVDVASRSISSSAVSVDMKQAQTPSGASAARTDALLGWLRDYAEVRINSRMIDERRSIPPYVVLDFGNAGLLAMQVSERYGGIGLDCKDAIRVIEQLSAIDLSLGLFVGLNNSLGIRPVDRYAQPSVREELLPSLAAGRQLASFALTEPGAGSNPHVMAATAVPDGAGGFSLTGSKLWIGSSSWAGVINVFAKVLDERGQPRTIGGFVVRQGTKGVRPGAEAMTMGMRGMVQNAMHFDGVRLGPESVLGELGSGMDVAQDAMMLTRLGLGAMSLGGMKRCAQLMVRYAERRTIATGRLLDNPVTLLVMDDVTSAVTSLECLVRRVAALVDEERAVPDEAFCAVKIAGPELLWSTADKMVQLLGGRGYMEPNIAPQILRDARSLRIFEGPTETLHMFLGSRLVQDPGAIRRFLTEDLGDPTRAEALLALAEPAVERAVPKGASAAERASGKRMAQTLLGEVVVWAFLGAAVEHAIRAAGGARGGPLAHASVWAARRYEEARARALAGRRTRTADDVARAVSAYVSGIGDVEQALAGEDIALDPLLRRDPPAAASAESAVPVLADRSAAAPAAPLPARRAREIEAWLCGWIAQNLGVEARAVDATEPIAAYGLDSVTIIRLGQEVEHALAIPVDPTLAWSYPSIRALSVRLAEIDRVPPPGPAATPTTAASQPEAAALALEALLATVEGMTDEEARGHLAGLGALESVNDDG